MIVSKRNFFIGMAVFIMISVITAFLYVNALKKSMPDAILENDRSRFKEILDNPLIQPEADWMNQALYYHNTSAVIDLYGEGLRLSDEEWIAFADTLSGQEFRRMIELGAPLDVSTKETALANQLYSINDDYEKWEILHEELPISYWVERPQLIQLIISEGNTFAFEDIIRRMNPADIPYEVLVPTILQAYQPQMLPVLLESGYVFKNQDFELAEQLNIALE